MFRLSYEVERENLRASVESPIWREDTGLDAAGLAQGLREMAENGDGSRAALRARMLKYVLENARLCLDARDPFSGLVCHGNALVAFREAWRRRAEEGPLRRVMAETDAGRPLGAYEGNADFGHTAPDWPAMLEIGYPGMLQRLRSSRDALSARRELTPEQADFFSAGETALEAVLAFLARLSSLADRCGEGYEQIGTSLKHLQTGAPRNFREALHFLLIAYHLQNDVEGENVRTLGWLDRTLLPFYRRDLEAGTFAEDEIRELLRFFYGRIDAMKVCANLPFCLAGTDGAGKSAANELTRLILDVYAPMAIISPKIQICVSEDTPDDLLLLAVRAIRSGHSSIVFIGDTIARESLLRIGCAPEHARNYVLVGCYETTAQGEEIPCTCNGIVNLAKAVEAALNDGVDPATGRRVGPKTGAAEAMTGFDQFRDAFFRQAEFFVRQSMRRIAAYEGEYPHINPAPLFSATLAACVCRGADAYSGGARYNNSSINAIGIANAADALLAVRRAVFQEKKVTLAQMRDILREDWRGAEALRLYCKNQCPKYGNGDAESDEMARALGDFVARSITGQPNGRGGIFRAGLFSIDWIFAYGGKTGATPDGRRRGESLSKNLCASDGMGPQGPTALIHAASSIRLSDIPNGSVLDLVLHTSAVQGENGLRGMVALMRTYFSRGGFGIQFNVLNAETLKMAQREPEKYAALQVRVCGWNAYFVDLGKVEQETFIRQAEM